MKSKHVDGKRLTLRLGSGVDADSLTHDLHRLWADRAGPRRTPPLSISHVESCGSTRSMREAEALRLLDQEGPQWSAGPTRLAHATLVSLDPGEYWLLLAAAGEACATALMAVADELCRVYPVSLKHC